MNTARLETFADGVFAIAATLLILNVDTGVGSGSRDLGARLLHIWPSYVGYGVSFLTIGIMWANHHMLMNQIGRVDRRFMMLTVGLLLCIAFVPFPTRLVAEHIRDDGARAAALAYGATMTAASIMFLSVWLYASRGMRLLRDDADLRAVRGITRSYVPGTPLYL
ncbi:MAG: TMEM175 family protein, partial [Gaiellaceae bacterium]